MFSDKYPDYPCIDNSIDTLEIDAECVEQMKRLDAEYIGDISQEEE
jgi:hypothetical protein